MKLPICNFDAKNSLLCPQCEKKVEDGILTKADVDAAIKLAQLSKSNQEIDRFTLYSCKEIGENYVLEFSKDKAGHCTNYYKISSLAKSG